MKNNHLWLPYTQMQTMHTPLEVASTLGCEITLKDGRVLLDGISSWWSACHGYNHPHLIQALKMQADQLAHVMLGGLTHTPALNLATQLAQRLPGTLNHVFFSESGSVAVEVALKMALQYWQNQNQQQKNTFVHFKDAYHGDTFYAMSVCCPDEGMHHLFKGQLPSQLLLPIPKNHNEVLVFEKAIQKHQASLAGLIIEPLIQGAGGMKCHSPEILNQIVKITQRYDIPVIFDEIFTGFGRTGTLFALNQIEHQPDIVCLGKALTGGVTPLAATVAASHIFDQFLSQDSSKALMHGPTFMGHALGCQVAQASLELFDKEPRLNQAKSCEAFLQEVAPLLKNYPGVKDVRVKGAMMVVEMDSAFDDRQLKALKDFYIHEGVWIRPFGHIIYLTPALNITVEQLNKLIQSIALSLKNNIHF